MQKNTILKEYKGFSLISETQIPDCSSQGIYLRHKKTGLEVFHLKNDDEENLFAFAFRTPVKNSTGAAHILEHSVFCGSQKFPLKEPFTNLMNQSVNTFLNALTYSDKTVYPASSIVKADYFNLMDVYADAVFFPLLKKEAFLQEAHRLELDENNELSIQGVVYNEMKGSYSSFESVANDIQYRSLFPDTNYAFDSGGDPIAIPNFTYEDFCAFHKKYYRPENCLVFLYGNIPTEEQLDFLQEKVLDRIEKSSSFVSSFAGDINSSSPFVNEEFVKIETPTFKEEKTIHIEKTAPSSGSTGSTVTVNWLCDETKNLFSYLEASFLSEVLSGHDASPLTKVLIESNLGDDLAPLSGVMNEGRFFSASFGLHGVKKQDEKKVYDLVLSTLENLSKTGVSKNDIDSALLSAEFSNREIVRSGGPYSLVLLERALNGWNYGENPSNMLLYREGFEKIRAELKKDDHYVEHLIEKFLLNNKKRSYVMVSPSESYLAERNKKEQELIDSYKKNVDLDCVKKDLDLLHEYQNHRETKEESSCIPSLSLKELKTEFEKITTDVKITQNNVPLFTNVEETNGIAYFEVCFPLDSLPCELLPFVPLFSYCATNTGWNKKNWAECSVQSALYTGGIFSRTITSSSAQTPNSNSLRKSLEKYNSCDRDYLVFTLRALQENLDEALNVFSEALSTFEFTDKKRIKTLCGEALSAIKSSIVPKGNRYALKRAQSLKTHSATLDEIFTGITQLFFITKAAKKSPSSLAKIFTKMKDILFKNGEILHITADSKTLSLLEEKLPNFIQKTNIIPPCAKKTVDEEKLKKLTILPKEKIQNPDLLTSEAFLIDSQVGFSAATFNGSFFGNKENASDLVLSHWLSGTLLWERIRTVGGAYGAYSGTANLSGLFHFSSFRDPSPFLSLETFRQSLFDMAESNLEEEDCVRHITGTYGDEMQPHSPFGRGSAGFFRKLYGITEEDRSKKLDDLLSVTVQDVKDSAKRLFEESKNMRTVVISNKIPKNTSVIVKLPL